MVVPLLFLVAKGQWILFGLTLVSNLGILLRLSRAMTEGYIRVNHIDFTEDMPSFRFAVIASTVLFVVLFNLPWAFYVWKPDLFKIRP